MTIYTSKGPEKKEEDLKYPQVVTELLVQKDNVRNEEALLPPPPPTLVRVTGVRRRSQYYNVCVLLTGLFVLITGVFGGIYLYKHLAQRRFRGWCGVRYYEYQEDAYEPEAASYYEGHHGRRGHHKRVGQFQELIEIDRTDWRYEKIEVPEIEDTNRATVLHDFEKNLTAIVDKDYRRCFILPLNRTRVIPPHDFWDLVSKIGSGYYLPDVELIREDYRVVHPPMQDLSPVGEYIWYECRRFDTYKLERHHPGDPVAMVKREVSGTIHFMMPGSNSLVNMNIIV